MSPRMLIPLLIPSVTQRVTSFNSPITNLIRNVDLVCKSDADQTMFLAHQEPNAVKRKAPKEKKENGEKGDAKRIEAKKRRLAQIEAKQSKSKAKKLAKIRERKQKKESVRSDYFQRFIVASVFFTQLAFNEIHRS
ncbi:unnamed protein product [Anisakis simplex]|uniref:Coiled-coil domain-containing protein 86 n=1 Tax=Anisakis simplex TaxID=6269 RepID=A0A0M3JKA5_ANISI|nr:unnamed protein product [Anisakis simplex]